MPSRRRKHINHFKRRMRQRYGINPSAKDYDKLIETIRQNHGKVSVHVYTQSKARTIKGLLIGDRRVPVVYDKKHKLIVTALPEQCLKAENLLQCGGPRYKCGLVAQGSEQSAHNRLVAGSNPAEPTKLFSK